MFRDVHVPYLFHWCITLSVATVIGLLYSPFSVASCSWQAPGVISSFQQTDMELDSSSYRMIANRNWYDDKYFPAGTLMAVDNLALKGFVCNGLPELADRKVDFVYVPPVGATRSGSGYLVAGNAPGVAMKVEFPARGDHLHGIFLGTSTGSAAGGGLTSRAGVPSFSMRLTLVKTGKFSSSTDVTMFEPAVWFPDGLGWFRYYAAGDPTLVAADGNRLVMGKFLRPGGLNSYAGGAMYPVCQFRYLGDVALVANHVIRLQSVSASDFSGIGPIDRATQRLPLKFYCAGTVNTDVYVSFDAHFPLHGAVEGVGLPEPDSDIGVQLLLGDVPVRFGERSSALPWSKVRLDQQMEPVNHAVGGFLTRQGAYCRNDCGGTMTGSNWVDGGAVKGSNLGSEPLITFRYYQTSSRRPVARTFSVPFTITMDWQ